MRHQSRDIIGNFILAISFCVDNECLNCLQYQWWQQSAARMVTHIESDEQFEQVLACSQATGKPTIVDFSAVWCGPCKRIFPTLETCAQRFGDLATFLKVDIDSAPETARKHGISSIPHVRAIDGASQTIFDVVGAQTAQLEKNLNWLLTSLREQKGDKAGAEQEFAEARPANNQEAKQTDNAGEDANNHQEADQAAATHNKLIYIDSDQDWIQLATEVAERSVPSLVQFSAAWCGPCRRMYPAMDQLVAEVGDRCIFARVDIDGAPTIAKTYNVSAVPYFAVFDAHGRNVDELRGADRNALTALVMRYVN